MDYDFSVRRRTYEKRFYTITLSGKQLLVTLPTSVTSHQLMSINQLIYVPIRFPATFLILHRNI